MAATARKSHAPTKLHLVDAMVILVGVAELGLPLKAFEAFVEHQVHYARHSVGSPSRRGAACHHIDALDQGGGQGAQVHATPATAADGAAAAAIGAIVGVGTDNALSVKKNQGSGCAQTAQTDGIHASVARARIECARAIVVRIRDTDGGEFADRVANIDLGVPVERGHVQNRHRRGRLIPRDRNA